jgi:6,7-dimethyl-8-ribityllumazine synthase
MEKIQGFYSGKGFKIAIIMSRFNEIVGQQLVSGAKDALLKQQVLESDIKLIEVPGAFEIPLIALEIASKKTYDAIICCGAVIKGDTPHFDMVANSVTSGIAHVSLQSKTPVINAVLTTHTVEQALDG